MNEKMDAVTLHPNSWLKEMARMNPVPWNFSRSFRAAFAIAFPMLVGYYTHTLMYTMWVSMGAMFPSIGERDAPYAFTIRKILISAPIGASGFLLGYFGTLELAWVWIVLLMSVLGFFLTIASSYSATVSTGCLQFMVMAAVSLGNPEIGHFWLSSVLLLCGALFYLFLIYLEKLIKPHHIRRDAIVEVLNALLIICQKKINKEDLESARTQFNVKYEALYNMMLQNRYQALGHNVVHDQTAAVVQNLDNMFAVILAEKNIEEISKLQTYLKNMMEAFQQDRAFESADPGSWAWWAAFNDLTLALWGKPSVSGSVTLAPQSRLSLRLMLQKLTPGKTTVRTAAALALCTAIGYSIRWVDHVSHWYWVPMTVGIVMKPELGSIFVRAVQRTVGTAAGVMVGGLLLALVPVGPLFIVAIAAITFVLPWLSPRNYALTAFAITPLVLVLIDFLSPVRGGLEYAGLRLVDTLMGCAIVLLFGYLLWPRRHASELNQAMDDARLGIAHYLELVLAHRLQPEGADLSEARRAAYGKLVDMRAALQKSMAEPPPAGYEAVAWFPLVACAARLCDAITVYSASASVAPDPTEWAWLQQMPQAIAGLQDLPTLPDAVLSGHTPESLLIANIRKETHVRERLYERVDVVEGTPNAGSAVAAV